MFRNRRRLAVTAAVVVLIAAAIFGGRIIWRASDALHASANRTAAESSLRFTDRPIDSVLPAGFESVGAPAVFADAIAFNGRLYVAGPAGLAQYDDSSQSARGDGRDLAMTVRFRPGIELPPAPITALAVGIAGDSHSPELWIATSGEGLVAFDGHSFRHIRAEEARFRKLTSILALPTGRILMGTEKSGVLVYDGRELKPFHESLADVHVTALAGGDASLWIGTLDRGLLHWKAGTLESIAEGLPDRQILSIAQDGETIYAGTGLGVAEIKDGGDSNSSKVARTLAAGYFAQSLLAADGKLWIGTLEEGMVSVPLAARPGRDIQARAGVCDHCSIRKILSIDNEVYALAQDSLWRGHQPILARENSPGAPLADRNISALSVDSTGRLWIGYFDHGLQILEPGGPGPGGLSRDREAASVFQDDHLFCINRIAQAPSSSQDARGITAVATANGLVLFDSSTARRRVLTHDDGLIANQVTDVILKSDGGAIAATPAGVSFIDATGISSIYAFQGLVNNHVYALASDGSRTLAGTLGGLSILDGGIVKASYTTSNSALKHNWITSIVRAGNSWFLGTYGAGVLRMDSAGRIESFSDLRGEIDINQNAMAASDRAVYAGTLDRGLAIYNLASDRWNFWTRGLPSRNVTAVEARAGMLYIGTDNGLVKAPETAVLQ